VVQLLEFLLVSNESMQCALAAVVGVVHLLRQVAVAEQEHFLLVGLLQAILAQ
jgi:hypothetical protein